MHLAFIHCYRFSLRLPAEYTPVTFGHITASALDIGYCLFDIGKIDIDAAFSFQQSVSFIKWSSHIASWLPVNTAAIL